MNFAIIDDVVCGSAERRQPQSSPRSRARSWSAPRPALKTKTGNVGFVGGVDVPLIQKFEAGFKAGAEAVKPDIKVQVKYLDPAAGLLRASTTRPRARRPRPGMFDDGADIVYQAAGGSGGWRLRGRRGRQGPGHRRRLRPVQSPPTRR